MNSQAVILGALGAFFVWRFLKFWRASRRMPELLEQGAMLVDVRSEAEFQQGHHPRSINVPLPELAQRCREWNPEKAVVLCCASGSRSGMAALLLKAKGFREVWNVGPWTNTLPRS